MYDTLHGWDSVSLVRYSVEDLRTPSDGLALWSEGLPALRYWGLYPEVKELSGLSVKSFSVADISILLHECR